MDLIVQKEKGKLLDHMGGQAVVTGFGTTPSTKLTTNSERKVNNLISILKVNDAEISSAAERLNEIIDTAVKIDTLTRQ